jgi:hypothetical protein
MSWIGVRELGYSGADVVRYLGVTNSCVTRMISTGKKQDIGDIEKCSAKSGMKWKRNEQSDN